MPRASVLLPLLLLAGASRGADSIDALVEQMQARPADLELGNRTRALCRTLRQTARCVDLINQVAASHPAVPEARYQAALAYVDELPGHSILKQGRLSSRSMDHASAVLAARPDDWLALYIRGMNHLYWPLIFRHLDSAIADLRRCATVVEALPAPERKSYHALVYLALGDALARKGEPAQARAAWQRAAELDPGSAAAAARLRLRDEEQADFVAANRDLDKPIDTDLAFLWRMP
ncbi:MAG TPA: tetratricopeptide repeat protein [Myxococcales bacterium]